MSDTKDSRSDSMSSPSSLPDKTAEQTSDKMAALRNAKKRKAEDRDSVLQDLKKQVGSLADAMSNKPEVVTRQKDEDAAPPPSFSTEVLRTAAVALMGLGTWYVSNIWAKRPKLAAPVPAPPGVTPAPPCITPAPTVPTGPATAPPVPLSPVVPKASPTHFIDLKPKRKIGASGLLE
jgi:hypothetical protein